MDPGGEHLFARCVLFNTKKEKIALVSVEMLTIPASLAREVKARIPKDIHLFLSATHTHSAPDSQMLNDRMTFSIPGVASYRSRWLAWYADKIAFSILESGGNEPEPVSRLGDIEVALALNRGRRAGAAPDALATMITAEHIVDKSYDRGHLPVFQPLFFSYAAHAVLYGAERNQTSGDWPGFVSSVFDPTFGAFPILQGAIGDVSPAAEGSTPKLQITRFSQVVWSAVRWHGKDQEHVLWDSGESIKWISEPILLDAPVVHPDFVKAYKIPQALADALVKKFAQLEAEISAFRFGSLAVVGIPGEPTSHLGRRIKEAGLKMGFKAVLVVSHVNGWIGYILDPVDYSHGGYEATLSFNGPQEGEHVVDAAIKALKRLRRP
jgi:hypothetical protein